MLLVGVSFPYCGGSWRPGLPSLVDLSNGTIELISIGELLQVYARISTQLILVPRLYLHRDR